MLPCNVTLNTRPNMLHTQNSRCVACCDSNDNIAMLICYVWHSIQLIFILLLVVYDTAVLTLGSSSS